ncbi:MAG: hypothetical protein HFI88_14565, partial [Lachnospiraceae bacterium]|nr:hypothetical protein [Lachnospiraceae bacterium]
EKARQAAEDAANAYKESSLAINDQAAKYKELKAALEEANGNEEATYNIKKQLYEMQQNLIATYGDQAEGLDLVNGSLETQLNLLKNLPSKEADYLLNENHDGVKNAEKEMTRERKYILGMSVSDPDTFSSIQEIADKYEEIQATYDDTNGEYTIRFTGDVTQAKSEINDFATDIRKLQDEIGENHALDNILGFSQDALSQANSVLEKYGNIYKEAQTARLTSDDTLYVDKNHTPQTADKWLSDYAQAVQAYNDALLTDDQDKISGAETKYNALKESIEGMTEDAKGLGKYADQFNEISGQLNEAAKNSNNFKKALSGGLSDSVEQIKGLSSLDLLTLDPENVTPQQAKALGDIVGQAREYGVITEDTENSLDVVVGLLAEWHIIEGDIAADAKASAQAMEALAESSASVQASITKAQDALASQSTGKSISADMFSSEELKDYADALEYVNGSYRLNTEKTRELVKAKSEEQIAVNDAAKTQKQADYIKNAAEISELTEKLQTNSSITDENAAAIQNRISSLQESNTAIVDECQQLDLLNASLRESTGAYQEWLDAQNKPESGDMFSDSLNAIQAIRDTANKDSDDYGRIGTEKYKAAVEFVIPDSVDRDDQEAVQNYLDSMSDILTQEDGMITGLNIDNFREKAVRESLMETETDENGEVAYRLASGIDIEDFAEKLNLSREMVQAMFGEMQEFGNEFEWPQIDTFGDGMINAEEAIQSVRTELESLREQQNNGAEVDESYIDELESTLAELEKKKVDLSQASIDNILANAKVDGQLEKAKEDLETLRDNLKEDPANLEIQAQVEDAKQKVDELQAKKDEFQEPTLLEIQMASNDISAQITAKQEELKKLSTATDSKSKAETGRLAAEIIGLQSQQVTINAYAETTGAAAKLQEINDCEIKEKNVTVSVLDKATVTLGAIQVLLNSLHDKNINISVNKKNNDTTGNTTPTNGNSTPANGSPKGKTATPASGPHSALDNFRQSDAAHANGMYKKSGSHTALVGELGREIVVDVHSGKWHTVGDNGAEFVEIPTDAIVFNHLQTEQLLKRGFVNGRGTALASGNVKIKGKAYGSGNNGKKSQAEKVFQTFDWVAEKLRYFAEQTKKAADMITDYVTLAFKKSHLKDQYDAIDDEITANKRGAKKYQKKADSIKYSYKATVKDKNGNPKKDKNGKVIKKTVKASVPKKYKNRVKNGTWSIENMDTSSAKNKALAEAIQSYQDYYDKAKDCKQAVIDLRNEQMELFEDLMDIPTEKAEKKIDKLNDDLDILGAKYENLTPEIDKDRNLVSVSAKNKNLNQQTKNQKKITADYETAYEETQANLKKYKKSIDQTKAKALKGLSSKDKKAIVKKVNAGEEITVKDGWSDKAKKAVTKYNIALRANREAYVNAEKAAEECTKAIRDNTKEQFDNIQAAYENKQKAYGQRSTEINNAMDLNEARGYRASSGYYAKLAENEKGLRDSLLKERKKLQKKFDSAVNSRSIAEYSDEWYSMKEQIDNITNSITESDIALQGFNNSIRELEWENFEKLQEKISSLTDEADFYINELSREDLADDDTGKLTDRGSAVMKLHAVNYETYRAQAGKYAKEIEKINSDLVNDPANETLLDKKEEYIKAQRESVKAAQDEKYAMIDLAKQGYEAQKNYLQKVIGKYRKLLSIQKDANDYQKTLSDAVEEINAVQKQLSALSGDNSESSRARKQELTASLKEKQEALKDKQMDKLTSDINDMLDDLMDDYSDYMDDIINNLSENFEQLIDTVNVNSEAANGTLQKMSENLNIELQGLKDVFSGGDGGNVLAATQNTVKNIETQQAALVEKATQIADSLLGSEKQSSTPDSGLPVGELHGTQRETESKEYKPARTTAATVAANVDSGKRIDLTDVKSYIKKHASKTSKNESELSDFNKVIYKNKAKLYSGSNKVLSAAELKALAKMVGVKYDNATKKGALYKEFKALGIKGFASGSHRIPYDQLALTQEKGPEVITLPDGTMLTPLKAGSKVFNHEMTENLWKISQNEDILNRLKETAIPRRSDGIHELAKALSDALRSGASAQTPEKFEIHFGDIHLPNVQNPEQFTAEIKTLMKNSIKNDAGMQKLLEEVTIRKLGRNYNSLGIRRF